MHPVHTAVDILLQKTNPVPYILAVYSLSLYRGCDVLAYQTFEGLHRGSAPLVGIWDAATLDSVARAAHELTYIVGVELLTYIVGVNW